MGIAKWYSVDDKNSIERCETNLSMNVNWQTLKVETWLGIYIEKLSWVNNLPYRQNSIPRIMDLNVNGHRIQCLEDTVEKHLHDLWVE